MWVLKVTQIYIEDGWRISVTHEYRDTVLAACIERLTNVQSKLDDKSQVTLRWDGRK